MIFFCGYLAINLLYIAIGEADTHIEGTIA